MSNTKHTKGPWSYIDAEGYNTIEGNDETIALVPTAEHFRANHKTEEGQANRRLIAAAPDLLEALELLIEYADMHGEFDAVLKFTKAKKAITKAKGGTE